ncbi:MAG: B12-binding domain-containing protein, partial [Chloroflexi bacterium]|nr:B12-binding domain-containing protein [Chloroflexota bacterium]
MSKTLVTAISEIQDDEALRLVNEALDKGEDPDSIMRDCQEAMRIVGDRYEKNEYFLPELLMSGMILKQITEVIKPKLMAASAAKGGSKHRAKVVLGTVRGDIHDIGKD